MDILYKAGSKETKLQIEVQEMPHCCGFRILGYPRFFHRNGAYGWVYMDPPWDKYKSAVRGLVKELAEHVSKIGRFSFIMTDSINQKGVKYSEGPYIKDIVDILREEGLGHVLGTRAVLNPSGGHEGSKVKVWMWVPPKALEYNKKENAEYWNEDKKPARRSESRRDDANGRAPRAGVTARRPGIRRVRSI